MIPIGKTFWFASAWEQPVGHGETRLSMLLTPQARRYRAGAAVDTRPFQVNRTASTYELSADRKAEAAASMARELADEVVRWCNNVGLVDSNLRPWMIATYNGLIECCQRGYPDDLSDGQVDEIDLRRIIVEERAVREQSEYRRLLNEARAAGDADAERRKDATRRSFDLLVNWLTPAERDEAASYGRITVKNDHGTFVVPVGYGKVARYVDGKPEAEYCMVFESPDIPLGDEVLMKVGLIKTDPERFLKEANRFAAT